MLLYLAQEGRGIGLVNKLRAYKLQDARTRYLDANRASGHGAPTSAISGRRPTMLKQLGIGQVRLLTNNPG